MKKYIIYLLISGIVKEVPYVLLENGNAVQINSEYNGEVTVESNKITVKAL
jgi:hypothetical protein